MRTTRCGRYAAGWGCLLALLALSACSPALEWREVRPEGAGLLAQFPCKPDQDKRPGMGLAQCKAADLSFGLSWADLPSPAQVSPALAQMRAALAIKLGADPATALQAVDVPGMTPNTEAGAQHLVGTKGQARVAVFSRGLRVYQAVMLGPKPLDEAAWRNFLGSLKCVEAARP